MGNGVNGANAATISPKLIGVGDNLPVTPKNVNGTFPNLLMDGSTASQNPVPFQGAKSYAGNKSAVIDYGNEYNFPRRPNLTPDVQDLQAMSNGGLHIGSSGAISMWVNPINHNPNGYQYFFDIADGSGNRFRATANSYDDGPAYDAAQVKVDAGGVASQYNLLRYQASPNDPYGWGETVNWGGNGTPASFPGGSWSNFVFTWGEDYYAPLDMNVPVLRVYVNGELLLDPYGDNTIATEVWGMAVPDFYATVVDFGARGDRNNPFAAMFDEIAIWDTMLTHENAQWIYQNSLNGLITPVPEPTSATLLALGLIGLGAFRRGRRR